MKSSIAFICFCFELLQTDAMFDVSLSDQQSEINRVNKLSLRYLMLLLFLSVAILMVLKNNGFHKRFGRCPYVVMETKATLT